jgi:hypothetical protein
LWKLLGLDDEETIIGEGTIMSPSLHVPLGEINIAS